jgi:predicted amidohydrolase
MITAWILRLSLLGLVYQSYSQEMKTEWTFTTQRPALSPKHWEEQEIHFQDRMILALAGDNNEHANGSWIKRTPIQGGAVVEFSLPYQIVNIDDPNRSVLTSLKWLDINGQQIGPKEFPRPTDEEVEGWQLIHQVYQVPDTAHGMEIELIYRWDADGIAYFADPECKFLNQLPKRIVKLAAIHHKPGSSTTEKNLLAFGKYVEEAGRQGADIVCLPEAITLVGTGLNYVEAAESLPGPTSRFLGEVARRHKLYIVAGILEKEGDIVYNTAIFIDREGQLAGKYRKVCLPREEIEGGVTPGQEFPVFETDFGKIGIMICWDVAFPEPARALAMQGADIILLPIWGGNLTLAKARSIENQVYLVSSTYDTDEMLTGVFDLEGKVLAQGNEEHPVVVVEVDLNEQKLWPWLGEFKNRIPQEMPSWTTLSKSH